MSALWFTDTQPLDAGNKVPGALRGSCERVTGSVLPEPVWLIRVSGLQADGGDDGGWQRIEDLAEEASVLLDLTQIEIGDQPHDLLDPLADMLQRVGNADDSHSGRVAVVCSRESVRTLFAHLDPSPVMFRSRGDALQAIVMAGDGLGPGWTNNPRDLTASRPRRPRSGARDARSLRLVSND